MTVDWLVFYASLKPYYLQYVFKDELSQQNGAKQIIPNYSEVQMDLESV